MVGCASLICMTEFGFIEQIKGLFGDLNVNGFEGIGDDCAVLAISDSESLVFTSDMLIEGVHFLRPATSARMLGRKALAVNLSDIAAMGARPQATLLSLSLPDDATKEWAQEFIEGYHSLSKEWGVALVGGDTTRSESGISISVTAIGRVASDRIKRRSAARVGDIIFVSATLGASGAGLRDILAGRTDSPNATIHHNPTPHILEGKWLGSQVAVHAMMDISDGVASDIRHILKASGVGCEIELSAIPIANGATDEDALTGGEDYRLLFTVDAAHAERLSHDFLAHFGYSLHPIGRIIEGDRLVWMRDNRETDLDFQGFTHF